MDVLAARIIGALSGVLIVLIVATIYWMYKAISLRSDCLLEYEKLTLMLQRDGSATARWEYLNRAMMALNALGQGQPWPCDHDTITHSSRDGQHYSWSERG